MKTFKEALFPLFWLVVWTLGVIAITYAIIERNGTLGVASDAMQSSQFEHALQWRNEGCHTNRIAFSAYVDKGVFGLYEEKKYKEQPTLMKEPYKLKGWSYTPKPTCQLITEQKENK